MSKQVNQSVAVSTEDQGDLFLGRHYNNLDPKKRLTIPSEWRNALGSVVYVMPDRTEKCLNIYSKEEMANLLGKLREKMGLFDPKAGRILAQIGAVSQQLNLDVQGRIRICDKLLQFANLTTTVALVGSFRMVKLYDPANAPKDEVDIGDLNEAFAALGM